MMDDIRPAIPAGSMRFMHLLQQDLRDRGYSHQTEKTYLHWVRRFILLHNKRHPARMGAIEINAFLSYLGSQRNCSPGTQRIALNALIYLYRKYLQVELEQLSFEKARLRRRLPVVLTHDEVQRVLKQLAGKYRLMVSLLYGAGLRQSELLGLRVKDLDFELNTLTVRSGKGDKDRTTLLPQSLREELLQQIDVVARQQYRRLPQDRNPAEAPPASHRPAQTCNQGPSAGRYHQACEVPHLPPQLRHTPAAAGLRPAHHPEAARA